MDRYSRLIAFLKVLLPLAALALLSTLFLLSRSVDPTTTLPFGEAEISERMREERITGPYFSGSTQDGDQIFVTASSARPASGGRMAEAKDIKAQITLTDGGQITLRSNTGSFDPASDRMRFDGEVWIETTTGYVLSTDALEGAVGILNAQTDGKVTGTGPIGRLEAGQMVITSDSETDTAQFIFKNRVKLVYDPQNTKDNP